MSDGAFALFSIGVVMILVGVLLYAVTSGSWTPPCDGMKNGPQTYRGHKIECFYGDVVKVKP